MWELYDLSTVMLFVRNKKHIMMDPGTQQDQLGSISKTSNSHSRVLVWITARLLTDYSIAQYIFYPTKGRH